MPYALLGSLPLEVRNKRIAIWLLVCCAMVLLMVLIGGATRLMHAGLSIVEWRPITGTLPPLSAEAWYHEFMKYQHTPEYQKIHYGLSLAEFKTLYYYEYVHRLMGRITGLVFLVPLVYFGSRGYFSVRELCTFLAILALGGLQGFIGWFMVKSGLVDYPDVSLYRLALHLSTALLLYTLLLWQALRYYPLRPVNTLTLLPKGYKRALCILLIVTCIQIVSGSFVAGLDGGLIYNTFPTMNGSWLPEDLVQKTPFILNFFENPVMAQWMHRLIAFLLFTMVLLFTTFYLPKVKQLSPLPRYQGELAAALALQIGLGIFTLLYQVPLVAGVAHQLGAFVVITCIIRLLSVIRTVT